jgi:glucosamine kinase
MAAEDLIVGIDIGGTKTHLLAATDGKIIADEIVPSIDWRTWNRNSDPKALADLIRKVAGKQPAAIAIGAHGCDADWQCRQWETDLGSLLGGKVKVVNDSELMLPAAGFFSGIGVVSGTGSIAVARRSDGEMLVAGGWGWILGDEGSAAGIVREAARAVRGSIDLGESGDPLVAALMSSLDTDDPTKIGRLLNDKRSAAIWGNYAGSVFEAAKAGSVLALRVIEEGGRSLAKLVALLIQRGADGQNVVIGGGVAVEQPMLLQAFRQSMLEIAPMSVITLLRKPPVTGALALAEHILR